MDTVDFDVDALRGYLAAHWQGFTQLDEVQKFSVGQSNPTYLLFTNLGKYVMRRQPFGKLLKSAHQVDREFRVMASLPDVPLPTMELLCTDTDIIGSMFFVMSFVDGTQYVDPSFPELESAERAAYYDDAIDTLAKIHDADLQKTGLHDFGKGTGFFSRQIALWTKQYELSFTDVRPDMDHLIDWLPKNQPIDDGKVTLIHGDYKFDNMLFAKDQPKVSAVLDWELSTLGHPVADLAYFCMCLRMPELGFIRGLGDIDRAAHGIPAEQTLVSRYCAARSMDEITNWSFYLAFSFFRLASISQGVYSRHMKGNASSGDAKHAGKVTDVLASLGAELTS
ncbi:MAG: phosphotransferase family protein [Pseudomonadota bacterium]